MSNIVRNITQQCEKQVTHFKAGNLKNCLAYWQTITTDPNILNKIKGLSIPFHDIAYQTSYPKQIKFSEEESIRIDNEIEKMLREKIITSVDNKPEQGEYISNIFIRPKKDGSVRLILNLKHFNKFVEKKHFKMSSLQTAIDLMEKDAYLASVDFKSAYYSVSIRKSDRKYLRFIYKGQKYEFCVLPNGLTTGPREFTQVVKTLFKHLREMGHFNTYYIDDSFLADLNFSNCLQNVIDTVSESTKAGFVVHPEKSVLFPTKVIVYLGFILSTIDMTVRLTPEKIMKIKEKILTILRKQHVTIQEVAELVGKLVATFPGVTYGKLFYRQIDNEKIMALRKSKGDYSQEMTLSSTAKSDINWWYENLEHSFVKIESRNPDITIWTDASNTGYGGCTEQQTHRGQWTESEQELHINHKELLAILLSLQSLCSNEKSKTIKVLTDNTTALTYIANMGGKVNSCNMIARKIWDWAIARDIWLISAFIPGKQNCKADRLSRSLNENTEWSLHQTTFDKIHSIFPEINVDLFASHYNHKMDDYVSWLPDQNSQHCDAFTLDWSISLGYAFPPFNMIGRVLRKVELDKCDVILLVPDWPSQHWYSKFLSMLTSNVFYLPRGTRQVYNPINRKAKKIRARFILGRVSGSKKNIQRFQSQLQTLSSNLTGHKLINNIPHILGSSNHIVFREKLIPLRLV